MLALNSMALLCWPFVYSKPSKAGISILFPSLRGLRSLLKIQDFIHKKLFRFMEDLAMIIRSTCEGTGVSHFAADP